MLRNQVCLEVNEPRVVVNSVDGVVQVLGDLLVKKLSMFSS